MGACDTFQKRVVVQLSILYWIRQKDGLGQNVAATWVGPANRGNIGGMNACGIPFIAIAKTTIGYSLQCLRHFDSQLWHFGFGIDQHFYPLQEWILAIAVKV